MPMLFAIIADSRHALRLLCAVLLLALASCQASIDDIFPKAERPIPPRLLTKMKAKGMEVSSPILLRIFKSENTLEVWKQRTNGRYGLLESYEICKWSGKLGPKFKEGDRQAPEGFYRVGRAQMNPKSSYHLAFNIGYPNSYDRSHDRTGSHLMVHGACSSAGCYSMTDEKVEEIYSLARESLKGGQQYFQVQAYPFRMTAGNLAKNADSPHFEFWKMLKEGFDHFEITKNPPKVDVCEKRYVFNRQPVEGAAFGARQECPDVTMPKSLLLAYSDLREKEKAAFKQAVKRERLKAALKGEETALLDPDKLDIVAKGSEVLPPPTPVAPPAPEPAAEPLIAKNEGQDEDAQTESGAALPGIFSEGVKADGDGSLTATATPQPVPNDASLTPASENTSGDTLAIMGGAESTAGSGMEGATGSIVAATESSSPSTTSSEADRVQRLPESVPVPVPANRAGVTASKRAPATVETAVQNGAQEAVTAAPDATEPMALQAPPKKKRTWLQKLFSRKQ